ncbi:oxysterol-binding protein related protein OSH2 [Sugiyamaella lignohabitans]|uniref:Oxysterol-binding protein related protein OSH2 n=1 Tax=Sugiyamaella lignohabitans TaxID=796027 RepID=A0A167BZT2_9ASCO|nr:oxysterol-binding protein related protein OSH2 [Sugiyamaella lignohabitans]ANB11032.1 oxysterol-binding protein related protein OSH2 [Sugiyamaella lignohabitans]
MYGRQEIALLLLNQPQINDTIVNSKGKQPVELSKTPQIAEAMQIARAQYVEKVAFLLKKYLDEENTAALEELLSIPRASALLDINGQDPVTGGTVLHDFVRKKNKKMVEFILSHGGDPFKRDFKGVLPIEVTKDDTIKKMLKAAKKEQTVIIGNGDKAGGSGPGGAVAGGPRVSGESPNMKGYLKKWTNFTGGYKLRWFVLENGVLSYYKRQDDIQRACRGSVNLKEAKLHLDSSEKLRFEVVIRGSNSKFHLKGNHPVETNRWVWALQNAIQYAKDQDRLKNGSGTALSASSTGSTDLRRSGTSGSVSSARTNATTSTTATGVTRSGSAGAAARGDENSTLTVPNTSSGSSRISSSSRRSPSSSSHSRSHSASEMFASTNSKIISGTMNLHDDAESRGLGGIGLNSSTKLVDDILPEDEDVVDDDDDDYSEGLTDPESFDEEIGNGSGLKWGRFEDSITLEANAIRDLLTLIRAKNQKNIDNQPGGLTSKELDDSLSAMSASIETLESVAKQHAKQFNAQERYYQQKIDQAETKERLWAKNLRDLELEHQKIQGDLHSALQKRKEATKLLREAQSAQARVTSPSDNSGVSTTAAAAGSAMAGVVAGVGAGIAATTASSDEGSTSKTGDSVPPNPTITAAGQASKSDINRPTITSNEESDDSDDDDDEFFDTLPEVTDTLDEKGASLATIHESTSAETLAVESDLTSVQEKKKQLITGQDSFAGYEDGPRKRLKLDADDRPKISLWGVLKSLIGKDMTKMTLPVSFNECTNLLQRSAEDMEYTDILDRGAKIVDDPALRLAHVAAFAASSYSSTINRIAKPFNPLLGETFEYCRPDCGYRLFSEQVSHHPPIGALYAEAPKWDFYGASNVKSQFYGRSFDINPLGRWYLTLRPDAGAGVEEELYSFKKVTSSVVGIITGSPIVDNYGDMDIINHTLGYKCTVNFKPRGWSGKNAYELKGRIVSPSGKEEWIVGGRWNDKIIARRIVKGQESTGDGVKLPAGDSNAPTSSANINAILLWKVHDRPPAPFNLTAFAITLNDLPDKLARYIAPTDTRLRPDQRAMEEGRYDAAADEKKRVEEKQRAARRLREQSGVEYKPLWFKKDVHPVTGEEYYTPTRDYWQYRQNKSIKTIAPDIF